MKTPRYSVAVAWSDEDEAYVATVPELPGVSAVGSTPAKAATEVAVALEMAIEELKESGRPLPEPARRHPRSGNLHLRIPRSLHVELARLAELEDVSLNHYLVRALDRAATIGGIEHQVALLAEDVASRVLDRAGTVAPPRPLRRGAKTDRARAGRRLSAPAAR